MAGDKKCQVVPEREPDPGECCYDQIYLTFQSQRDRELLRKVVEEARQMRRSTGDQIKYLLEFWYARKFGYYKEDIA